MDIFTLAQRPELELIPIIRRGLSAGAFTYIARALNIPSSTLATKLHIRAGTVVRGQANRKPLSLEVSEKVIRIARIRNLAQRIFTNDHAIGHWLTQASPALDGAPPLDWLDTETGARRVENLLHSIMHGHVS